MPHDYIDIFKKLNITEADVRRAARELKDAYAPVLAKNDGLDSSVDMVLATGSLRDYTLVLIRVLREGLQEARTKIGEDNYNQLYAEAQSLLREYTEWTAMPEFVRSEYNALASILPRFTPWGMAEYLHVLRTHPPAKRLRTEADLLAEAEDSHKNYVSATKRQ